MNAYLNILQELAIMKGARWDSGPKKITIIIIMVIRKAEQLFNKSWWMGFFISEEKTFSM
jgi:hypothetical protein